MSTPAYDRTKDQFYSRDTKIARKGLAITPSDSTDLTTYAVIYALTAGTVVFIPVLNDDTDPITMTVPVGWQSPWQVRRVKTTGTSATFRTLEKFLG